MKTNYHTHSTYCDGKNTPEEMVLTALDKGFSAIGFSGHGFTAYDTRYCMMNTNHYLGEIARLKEAYKEKIQIYIGIEEDAFSPVDRSGLDYIIGSSHYIQKDGVYYPIDSGLEYFERCLEMFAYDPVKLAESYYQPFCQYIRERKPDIVGHFDLITKFDEISTKKYFLNHPEYLKVAEKYIDIAAQNDVIFEINTGAIARGIRTKPYPQERLLYRLKNNDCKLILSSDCHQAELLDCAFDETRKLLKEIGFRHLYVLYDNCFQKEDI